MVGLVEAVAPTCVVREIPGITKCFLNEDKENKTFSFTTEGSNMMGLWQFTDILDTERIETNDIAVILRVYGVEAARRAIVKEISGVFAVYGRCQ